MTIRGGGAPSGSMALKPLWRMDPPLRSFAADAHYCIMVWILWIRRIQVCGAMVRACWRASLRSSVDSMSLSTGHAEGGAERRNSMLDFRSPIQVLGREIEVAGAKRLDHPLDLVHARPPARHAAAAPVHDPLRPPLLIGVAQAAKVP